MVAVCGRKKTAPVPALIEDRVRTLESGNAGPIERRGIHGDAVAARNGLHPIVEPADHDRDHRGQTRRIAARLLQPDEAAFDSLPHRDGLGDGEANRGVDVHALRGCLFHRRDAGLRRRELDLDVLREAAKTNGLLDHAVAVRVVGRVRLNRKPASASGGSLMNGRERRRPANGHGLDDRPGQLDFGPSGIGHRELADARLPVVFLLAEHVEYDRRVRSGPGRAAVDRVGELTDGARVVPVLRRSHLDRSQ